MQCKSAGSVSLDDVATAVGLTHLLRSNVIVVLTTSNVEEEARRYANRIIRDCNLPIVMVDGNDIAGIIESPSQMFDVLAREASHAMTVRELEI